MDGRTDWMEEWMNEWTNERMNEWGEEGTNERIIILANRLVNQARGRVQSKF